MTLAVLLHLVVCRCFGLQHTAMQHALQPTLVAQLIDGWRCRNAPSELVVVVQHDGQVLAARPCWQNSCQLVA